MTVHIDWGDPNTDWDLYVYDENGNVDLTVGIVRRHDRGRDPLRPAGRAITRR